MTGVEVPDEWKFGKTTRAMLSSGLSDSACRVWAALDAWYGGYETVFPSVATLASHVGKSSNATRRALHELVDGGWLVKRDRPGATSEYEMIPTPRENGRGVTPRENGRGTPTEFGRTPLPNLGAYRDREIDTEGEIHTAFDTFWNLCPRKTGKGRARKAWEKATKTIDDSVIIDAMRAHADHWDRDRTEMWFIPHPATWLNEERWDDTLVDTRSRGVYEQTSDLVDQVLARKTATKEIGP
jgi:hypothetical protein